MPFNFRVKGMDELIRKMDKLPEKAAKIAAEALYEGAGITADAVSRGVHGIRTEPFKYAKEGHTRKPSPEEKEILMKAKKGIAKFRRTGTNIQTSVGMQNSGYAMLKGKRVPIPKIVNAVNSGTSFMEPQPFLNKAFSKSRRAAIAAIENGIKKRMDELNIE